MASNLLSDDGLWRTPEHRKLIINEINAARSQNPSSLSAKEMENIIFSRARDKQDYFGNLSRLTIMLKNVSLTPQVAAAECISNQVPIQQGWRSPQAVAAEAECIPNQVPIQQENTEDEEIDNLVNYLGGVHLGDPQSTDIETMLSNLSINMEEMEDQPTLEKSLSQDKEGTSESMLNQLGLRETRLGQNNPRETRLIWNGKLEWMRNYRAPHECQAMAMSTACQVSCSVKNGEAQVSAEGWPSNLSVHLIPKSLLHAFVEYFADSQKVNFELQNCEAVSFFTHILSSGFAGSVHFTGLGRTTITGVKVGILLYSRSYNTYIGIIPNDQYSFINTMTNVVLQKNLLCQPPLSPYHRKIIWNGTVEYLEKVTGPLGLSDNVSRHLPFKVSSNVVGVSAEAQVTAKEWPPKMFMQLIPRAVLKDLGGGYFRDSKTVLFMSQKCGALDSLTNIMDSGFAGCVHVRGPQNPFCPIRVLVLLYCRDRSVFLGFIPNDQSGFFERMKIVIQLEKDKQMVPHNSPTSSPEVQQPPNLQLIASTPQSQAFSSAHFLQFLAQRKLGSSPGFFPE